MKNIPYGSVIVSLLYAKVCTRVNIGFTIGILGRFWH